MADNLTGIHLSLSYCYNMMNGKKGEPPPLAIQDRPDLGPSPHAQDAMKALGITYLRAIPSSITDSWRFYHCRNVPDVLPKWLSIMGPISNRLADALNLPREENAPDA